MKKGDLVQIIGDRTGIPKVDVLLTIEALTKEIKEAVIQGETVYLRGFGSFFPKKRAAKIGRNVKQNTAVPIPAMYIAGFKPGKEFGKDVKTKCKKPL